MTWSKNCVLSNVAGASTFKITDAKLKTLCSCCHFINRRQSKLLIERFKRSVYWNEYKVIPEERYNTNDNIRKLIDPSWQGINRLFVLAYLNDLMPTVISHRKYFLPRVEIKNYNIEIDGSNFYDQPVNDLTKQYDEVRKISTGQGDD